MLELLQFQTAHGAEPDHQPVVLLELLQEVQFVRFPADSRHLLSLVVPLQNPHELSYNTNLGYVGKERLLALHPADEPERLQVRLRQVLRQLDLLLLQEP